MAYNSDNAGGIRNIGIPKRHGMASGSNISVVRTENNDHEENISMTVTKDVIRGRKANQRLENGGRQ